MFPYYEAFPAEMDAAIAEVRSQTFDTLKRKLPQLERKEVAHEEHEFAVS